MAVELINQLSDQFLKDLNSLKKEDKNLLKRVEKLIRVIKENPRDPYYGYGKPEALAGDLAGLFSRRINEKHRLVYKVDLEKSILYLVSCFSHYGDK